MMRVRSYFDAHRRSPAFRGDLIQLRREIHVDAFDSLGHTTGIPRAYCGHTWACNTGQRRSIVVTRGHPRSLSNHCKQRALEEILGAGDGNRTRVLSLGSRVRLDSDVYIIPHEKQDSLSILSKSALSGAPRALTTMEGPSRSGLNYHFRRRRRNGSSFRGCRSSGSFQGGHSTGITRTRIEGAHRYVTLREGDLNRRFPGLLDVILTGQANPAREAG